MKNLSLHSWPSNLCRNDPLLEDYSIDYWNLIPGLLHDTDLRAGTHYSQCVTLPRGCPGVGKSTDWGIVHHSSPHLSTIACPSHAHVVFMILNTTLHLQLFIYCPCHACCKKIPSHSSNSSVWLYYYVSRDHVYFIWFFIVYTLVQLLAVGIKLSTSRKGL